ncbi:MAG: glycosyltransferase family 4 protein [Pseudomonadota bacterium]
MRVLIVAPNFSNKMGGEAILPLHYVQQLQHLGVEVHGLTHARCRDRLNETPFIDQGRMHFIEDSTQEKVVHRFSKRVPAAIRDSAVHPALSLLTLRRLAEKAGQLEQEIDFDVIHQPTPVSPSLPSFLSTLKTPLVIGPLNGGMSFPPGFAGKENAANEFIVGGTRAVSSLANRLVSGKQSAARILVANERTRAALPASIDQSKTRLLVENGVDIDLWTPEQVTFPDVPEFVYVGRLVWWKAIDHLLRAMSKLERARLTIIGDGEERASLEAMAADIIKQSEGRIEITFTGFLSQPEIRDVLAASTALVLSSLRECGGAVVLEAFACGKPAIATNWGGPTDYITQETGFLIDPGTEETFSENIATAMKALSKDPGLAQRMGATARSHVQQHFSWRAKAEQMLKIFEEISPPARQAA